MKKHPFILLSALGNACVCILTHQVSSAQIVPDTTLPVNSILNNQGNTTIIEGGTSAGGNLFHSFTQFSVPTNGTAFFNNNLEIQNIFSRVTGGSISNIDGIIRANGTANLFLLNPNGIIFGPNARLNIGGSFLASTGTSINFVDGTQFSAAPNQTTSLLTVSVPIGLQIGNNPGQIQVQNTGHNWSFDAESGLIVRGEKLSGLQVQLGKSLALIGGNVNLEGGILQADGGRIELGGLAAEGVVGINSDGSLNFPENIERADVSLANKAVVNAIGAGGGSIGINSRNLDILGNSILAGGIGQNSGDIGSQAGNITIDSTGNINIRQLSVIENRVNRNGIGNSGNIDIKASSLSITDGAFLSGSSFGLGNGGDININLSESLTISGQQNESASRIASAVSNGVGNGGRINIAARSVFITDGASMSTFTSGKGDAGNININAASISLTNEAAIDSGSDGQGNAGNIFLAAKDSVSLVKNSTIFNNVGLEGAGNVGNIRIEAGSLSLTERSQIQAGISSGGRGNPGIISVQVRDNVTISGEGSAIFSNTDPNSIGNGSDIEISAGSVSLINGAQLIASTAGQGNAGNIFIQAGDLVTISGEGSAISSNVLTGAIGNGGNITIEAGSLFLTDRARVGASNFAKGEAGDISLQIRDSISITNKSFIASSFLSEEVGKGGSINIEAGSLYLDNNSFLATQSGGQGNAGNISVQATGTVSLTNESSISSTLGEKAVGNGGSIKLQAGSVSLSDGAILDTSNYGGRGDAGSILVQATGAVSLTNESSISSSFTEGAVGNGGSITLQAGSVSLSDESYIDTSNYGGRGDAGSISVETTGAVTLTNKSSIASSIFSEEAVGNGGSITIEADSLFLTDGATVGASNFAKGEAGDISLQIQDAISITNNSFIASSFLSEEVGKGGSINIEAGSLSLDNNSFLSTQSNGQGDAGNISVEATGAVSLANESSILSSLSEGSVGKGGSIKIETGSLSLDNSFLSTLSNGQGDAGNISIQATGAVSLANASSIGSSLAEKGVGNGGSITIEAGSVSLSDRDNIESSTYGRGDAGRVSVQTQDFVSLAKSSLIRTVVAAGGVGKAGDIDIQTRSLSVTDGSQVQANVFRPQGDLPGGRGDGGTIRINATDSVNLSGIGSTGFSSGLVALSDREAFGDAGSIIVTTDTMRVEDGANVTAQTFNPGEGGDVTINANTLELINGGQIIANTRNSGNAGSIRLNVTKSITVSGSDPNFADRVVRITEYAKQSGDLVTDALLNDNPVSGIFANTDNGSSGNGGNLTIEAGSVSLSDGAEVTVSSQGNGEAGNLNIKANSVSLNNFAALSADTPVGNQANITVESRSLTLGNNSRISTNATKEATGGNITLNTDVLAALENSDINANAQQASGGRIIINSQGIFGTQFREFSTPESDITATSELGPQFSGTVTINTPDVDPSSGLINLPGTVVDATNLVASSCNSRAGEPSQFTVTGRGGLPPNPLEAISDEATWIDLRPSLVSASTRSSNSASKNSQFPVSNSQIVEATGWAIEPDGKLRLTASTPNVTLSNLALSSPSC